MSFFSRTFLAVALTGSVLSAVPAFAGSEGTPAGSAQRLAKQKIKVRVVQPSFAASHPAHNILQIQAENTDSAKRQIQAAAARLQAETPGAWRVKVTIKSVSHDDGFSRGGGHRELATVVKAKIEAFDK